MNNYVELAGDCFGGSEVPAIRDPYKMFAVCLNFYRSNPTGDAGVRHSAVFDNVRTALKHYLIGLSELHEGAYPGWRADTDNPGYMISIYPPATMRAPYHLISAFPSDTVLVAIWHLSRNVRTLPSSVLCLSGSAALISATIWISDIDFCEYVVGTPDMIADALASKMTASCELVVRRVCIGNDNAFRSSNAAEVGAMVRLMRPDDPEQSHAKVDFIGKPSGMRPTDISNVIIFCDDKLRSASLSRSFAAQEAHLDPVVAVPSKLCEPYEVGRYIDFLLSQAQIYLENCDYPKALKRCLSLARLCFLSNVAEEITQFIRGSTEFIEREIALVDALSTDVAAFELRFNTWAKELEWAREDLAHELVKARRRPPAESIQTLCLRVVSTLNEALSGRDLKAA